MEQLSLTCDLCLQFDNPIAERKQPGIPSVNGLDFDAPLFAVVGHWVFTL